MCGIAGWFAPRSALFAGAGADEAATLRAMTDALAHRGPDDQGALHFEAAGGAWSCALGHRRLAIIDLEGGVQPMSDREAGVHLAFNGQIYNYESLREELRAAGRPFRTNSDTEVALQAYAHWGADAIARFRGMFVISIWDERRERLLLARDRFGQKPLFWRKTADGGLIWASEIKGLLAHPSVEARLDRRALGAYFLYRYAPAPGTFFDGVEKMPPGSLLLARPDGVETRRYWVPPDKEARPDPRPVADPIGAFASAFDEAVRLRMMSDVPYGAFLSGGIDSSAVVACMSRHTEKPVRTFAVGFEEAEYSELKYAKSVAEQYGCEHSELVIRSRDVIDHLEDAIAFRDAPVAEASDVPILLLARDARRSVKMVLTGEGADEILGGYPKHRFEPYAASYQRLAPRGLRARLIEPLIAALPYRFRRAKTLAGSIGIDDPRERWPRWFGALDAQARARLLGEAAPVAGDDEPFSSDPEQSALRRALHFDQTSWLPDNLLERGDRMTMAASLEARMPFLDHRLAALVARLDDGWRIGGPMMTGAQKRVLREAFARELPSTILKRPKVGFRVPVNLWFKSTLKDWLMDLLASPASRTRSLLRADELDRLLGEHVDGKINHEKTLWTCAVLELFLRRFALSP